MGVQYRAMNARVLFVDDDLNLLESFSRNLGRSFQVDTAEGADEALRCLTRNGEYAVLVADQRMPGMDGVRFLQEASQIAPQTVRLMLTGYADTHTAIEAINTSHVYQFLEKPCPLERLQAVLQEAIQVYETKRNLHQASLSDPLTGLYNRRFLEQQIHRLLSRSNRTGEGFGLIFMDVNNFKQINDTFGHALGDLVLARMAAALTDECRESDVLCRYGGDEFVVLFDYSSSRGAEQFSLRLQEAVGTLIIPEVSGWRCSVSAGCASYPDDGADWEALMDVADRRMYSQKKSILDQTPG